MPKARKNRGKSKRKQNPTRGDDPEGVRTVRTAPSVTQYARDFSDDSSSDSETEVYSNRQRVLMLSSRGVAAQHRHLLNDMHALLPHGKKESKFDSKTKLYIINELAEMQGCNGVVFFEVRRHQDMFVWMTRAPNGPSVKFYCSNVHTMSELQFTGNCLKGSRAVLSFDSSFDKEPQWLLIKEMLTQIFGTPHQHPRSTHHVDHVLNFSILDGRVWFRNYQIVDRVDDKGKPETVMMEIGPRFVMELVRVFSGSFGGATLYQNPNYLAPAEIRRRSRREEAEKRMSRMTAGKKRQTRKLANEPMKDVLDGVFEE